MPFGKKLTEKLGKPKEIEIRLSNIHASVETFLRMAGAVTDSDDILAMNLDDVVGKKPGDIVRIGITLRKEV